MKKIELIFLVFFIMVSKQSIAQEVQRLSLNLGLGLGLVEGEPGPSVDVDINYKIFKKLSIGVYSNHLSSLIETNAKDGVTREHFIIETVPTIPPSDGVLYRSSEIRSQYSIGPQLGYTIINSRKVESEIGVGFNFNIYNSRRFIEDFEQSNFHHYTSLFRKSNGIGRHGFFAINFKPNQNFVVGVKMRSVYYIDYNFGFSLVIGTRI